MTASLSPLAIALGIILAVAVIGAFIALAGGLRRFAGFQDIAADAERIAKALGGELFRDGGDLVASGNLGGKLPTVVRFSNKENVPGLNIRMGVPAGFTLWIAPRSTDVQEGRATVRTGDMAFDTRFATRSDHATQARMFLGLPQVAASLRQLACSTNTFVALSDAALEVSELEIPRPVTFRHIQEHLRSMSALAEAIAKMPGADTIKVAPLKKDPKVVGRVAIVVGAATAMMVVLAATQSKTVHHAISSVSAHSTSGVLPREAEIIPGVEGWHAATADDYDADAVAWLRSAGQPVTGRLTGDFTGDGDDSDVAYVLARPDGTKRIVVLENGHVMYDSRYTSIAAVARVPKSSVQSIEWNGAAPNRTDCDGLLIVRTANDHASGLVLFISGSRVVAGVPANYQSISLQ